MLKKTALHILLIGLLLMCAGAMAGNAQAPVITSFSPAKAYAGNPVVIYGSNFNLEPNNNIVYFGAVRAKVISGNTTILNVEAPAGATFAPITVLNKATHLMAYSPSYFLPVFQSKGTFTALDFDAHVDFKTEDTPSSLAIGDLDGDGRPDMVTASKYNKNISIYKNLSEQGEFSEDSFAPKFDLPANEQPQFVELADVDGDGKLDILVANQISGNVSVYKNSAVINSLDPSSFEDRVDFKTGSSPYVIRVNDADADGRPDLGIAYSFNTSLINLLQNTTQPGTVNSNSFGQLSNFATGAGYYSLGFADLTNDGYPELIATDATKGTVYVYPNLAGNGSSLSNYYSGREIYRTTPNPAIVNVGDIDGDGKPDIVISNYGNVITGATSGFYVSVLLNNINGQDVNNSSFKPYKNFEAGREPISSALADLDGDGKVDVVTTDHGDNTVSLFHNISTPGDADFEKRVVLSTGLAPDAVRIADLDRDGRPDIVVINTKSNTISVLRNNALSKQVINFEPKNTIVYGTENKDVGARSNNPSTPVHFQSSNPSVAEVTAEGVILTKAVGTTLITASQDATADALAAKPKQQQLTVTPAPLVIKADNLSRPYNTPTPPFTFSYIGLVNGDQQNVVLQNIKLSSTAQISSLPAIYPIKADGTASSPNYEVSYADGMLTVTKLDQTISFEPPKDQSILSSDFQLAASTSSGLPVTFKTANEEVVTIKGDRAHITGSGTTRIIAEQPGNEIYNPISESQPVTIISDGILIPANTITPNGDGINDVWKIKGIEKDQFTTVKIYNRNGTNIFESKGYPKPFDGTYKGKYLPAGVYYFIVSFADGRKAITGNITVIY